MSIFCQGTDDNHSNACAGDSEIHAACYKIRLKKTRKSMTAN